MYAYLLRYFHIFQSLNLNIILKNWYKQKISKVYRRRFVNTLISLYIKNKLSTLIFRGENEKL